MTEAPATESTGTEQTEVATNAETVQPDTLYANKYKSVSELENGYTNLQTKLGSFTGSPDEYTPNEGMEIDDSNPLFSGLQELGREIGLNNDGFNKIIDMYNTSMEEQEVQYQETMKEEMSKLGDNASERVQNVIDWAGANLSESEVGILQNISQSADAVQLIEKFIGMSKPQGIATDAQVQTKATYDADKLNAMRYAKDDNGNRRMSVDPEYRQRVLDLESQHG